MRNILEYDWLQSLTKKVQDFVVSNIVVKGEVLWFPEDLCLIVVVAVAFAFTAIAVTGIERLLFYQEIVFDICSYLHNYYITIIDITISIYNLTITYYS
jgi:hypothetical protein